MESDTGAPTDAPDSSLSEAELSQVLNTFNATKTEYPKNRLVHELFEERATLSPSSPAIIDQDRGLTYAELACRADTLACHLRNSQIGVGGYIAVMMPRSVDTVVAQIAILKTGNAYVPIDPELPIQRREFILRDCGARAVIVGHTCDLSLGLEKVIRVSSGEKDTCHNSSVSGDWRLRMDTFAPAYVMYTSGSTGLPKGVIVPHRAINRLVVNNGFAQIGPHDCVAHCSNPGFDAATFEIWGALLSGARLVVAPQGTLLDVNRLSAFVRDHQISVMFLTSALFNYCAIASPNMFSGITYLMFGGEACNPNAVKQVLRHGGPKHLLNMYGPTETTTFATFWEATETNAATVPIGRPISNTQIYILNEDRRPVPIGVVGEIYIGGDGVALGYLNRPDLTAERFVAAPVEIDTSMTLYRTGDMGCWRSDGAVEYHGRDDFQIKIRGFRIEPGEIESILQQQEFVEQALVVGQETLVGEKRLIAYVTVDSSQVNQFRERYVSESLGDGGRSCDGKSLAESPLGRHLRGSLREHLKARLPSYMVPSSIVLIEYFPLTHNGKIDRARLPAPRVCRDPQKPLVSPSSFIEDALTQLWMDIFDIEEIGVDDNFFELGGSSLLAAKLMTEATRRFTTQLTFAAVLEQPTIRELARFIAKQLQDRDAASSGGADQTA